MNWADIIIATVLGINIFNGLRKGLVRSVFGLVAIVLAVYISIKGTASLAEIISEFNLPGPLAYLLALIIIFCSIFFLVNAVGSTVHDIVRDSFFMPLNILGGILLGFFKGLIIILFLIIPILSNTLTATALQNTFQNSFFLIMGEPIVLSCTPLIQRLIETGSAKWQDAYHNKKIENSYKELKKEMPDDLTDELKDSAVKYVIRKTVTEKNTDF